MKATASRVSSAVPQAQRRAPSGESMPQEGQRTKGCASDCCSSWSGTRPEARTARGRSRAHRAKAPAARWPGSVPRWCASPAPRRGASARVAGNGRGTSRRDHARGGPGPIACPVANAAISSRRVTASGTVSEMARGEVNMRELAAGVEGVVEPGHHRLLDLGAAELLGPRGEPREVEAFGRTAAAGQVDAEDLPALGARRAGRRRRSRRSGPCAAARRQARRCRWRWRPRTPARSSPAAR